MQIGISNIAWSKAVEPEVAKLLQSLNVNAVEIAPAKISEEGAYSTEAQALAYKQFWADHGISVKAMQALLFGAKDHCHLFESAASRQALFDHLVRVMDLGAVLGVEAYVFGSPKNRDRKALTDQEAYEQSASFWQKVGDEAVKRGGVMLIEPNPPVYGGDFIQTTPQAIDYVGYINHPGIGWHNDAGTIIYGHDAPNLLVDQADKLYHFHLSALNLEPVYIQDAAPYSQIASSLKQAGYNKMVSVEMKAVNADMDELAHVRLAIEYALRLFA